MISLAIARALKVIDLHPSVVGVEDVAVRPDGTIAAVIFIKTELWAAWRLAGESPSGVREIEPVTFTFGPMYPTLAPHVALRQDFRRDHPHLMPGPADEPPVPCIVDGRANELVELRGIDGLVEQLVEWLERAALGTLIDPTQGWEPVRRDGVDDVVVVDGTALRALARTEGGTRHVQTAFARCVHGDRHTYHVDHTALGAVAPEQTPICWEKRGEELFVGVGVGIVVWALPGAGGEPFVVDAYAPETVVALGDLRRRAADYRCSAQLDAAINRIAFRLRRTERFQSTPLTVTFLVRRPCDVIGTTSPIEICMYLIDVRANDDLIAEDRPVVRFCALKERLSLPILRRAAGEDEKAGRPPWTLLGCGSVGSKIALHMGRRGFGPSRVIDAGFIWPHNYARHALLPDPAAQSGLEAKAGALADALAALEQRPKALEQRPKALRANAIGLAALPEGRLKLGIGGEGLLDTTASTVLREQLAFAPWEDRPALAQAHLLGAGKVAYAAFEGAGGNPNLSDLATESYRLIAGEPGLAGTVFSAAAEAIAVGQGCSAFTAPMPDGRLSALAASLSEAVAVRPVPWSRPVGEVLIGRLGQDGLSQTWTREAVAPMVVVREQAGDEPGVRLSARVDATIRAEIAKRPGVEIGGVVIGRYSQAANVFQVVDLLPAPPDSTFAPERFILGTEGLRGAIDEVIKSSFGSLYALGTWHNHLGPFGPSDLDARTCLALALRQFFPVLMLIALPDGYTCLTMETFAADLLPGEPGDSGRTDDPQGSKGGEE